MNAIQTFYSFDAVQNPVEIKAGFYCAHMNWMSMALSCLLLKRHFNSVSLYCNDIIGDLMTNIIKIPYDKVVITPNYMDKYAGCNLWAYPKVYTYSLQDNPFIHVDTDFFMFSSPSTNILTSELIGQNIEYDDQMSNRNTMDRLLNAGVRFPSWVIEEYENNPILRVVNAGVLGGRNISFFKEYVEVINEFISDNLSILRTLSDGFVNSIYEQFFFYILAKKHQLNTGYFTEGNYLSTTFNWLPIDWGYSPKRGYMHILAGLKRRLKSYIFVNDYLKYMSPEIHKAIFHVCAENNSQPLLNDFDIESLIRVNRLNDSRLNSIEALCESALKDELMRYLSHRTQVQNILANNYKQLFYTQELNRKLLLGMASITERNIRIKLNPNIAFFKISKELYHLIANLPKQYVDTVLAYDSIVLCIIPDPKLFQIGEVTLNPIAQEIVTLIQNEGIIYAHKLIFNIENRKDINMIDNALRNLIKIGVVLLVD